MRPSCVSTSRPVESMSRRPAGARPRRCGGEKSSRGVVAPRLARCAEHDGGLVAVFGLAAHVADRLVQQDRHVPRLLAAWRRGRCDAFAAIMRGPSSAIRPFTRTQPGSIHSSASRRDAMPRSDITLERRVPSAGAGPGVGGATRAGMFGRGGAFGREGGRGGGSERRAGAHAGFTIGSRAPRRRGFAWRRQRRHAATHRPAARVAQHGVGLHADLGAFAHRAIVDQTRGLPGACRHVTSGAADARTARRTASTAPGAARRLGVVVRAAFDEHEALGLRAPLVQRAAERRG